MELKLGSLFDGIGGWMIAAVKNGIKPVWASDTNRYKELGNCMAQPCADYAIRGIALYVEHETIEME